MKFCNMIKCKFILKQKSNKHMSFISRKKSLSINYKLVTNNFNYDPQVTPSYAETLVFFLEIVQFSVSKDKG